MILSIITLCAFAFLVWAVAQNEASTDYKAIMAGVHIDHRKEWTQRAVIVGGAAVLCLILLSACALPGLLLVGAFGFSALFRYRLNTLRTLSPFYVSPSNYYDKFFLGLTNIGVTDDNEYDINAAGRLAYIVEASLSAAGALWVVFI